MGLVLAVIAIALGYGFMSEGTSATIGSIDVDNYTESGFESRYLHEKPEPLDHEVSEWQKV